MAAIVSSEMMEVNLSILEDKTPDSLRVNAWPDQLTFEELS